MPSLALDSVFGAALPGCHLHVTPDDIDTLFTTTGAVQSQILLPNTPPIVGLNWYDSAGNLVAAVAPGAKDFRAFTKSEFDGDGRNTATYYMVYTGSQPPTYTGATTVTNSDRVFEQTENTFDSAGNLTLNTSFRRYPGSRTPSTS